VYVISTEYFLHFCFMIKLTPRSAAPPPPANITRRRRQKLISAPPPPPNLNTRFAAADQILSAWGSTSVNWSVSKVVNNRLTVLRVTNTQNFDCAVVTSYNHSIHTGMYAVLQLRFDCNSTALYDYSATYVTPVSLPEWAAALRAEKIKKISWRNCG